MTDAFGIVALVALTPLIAIQLMGLIYKMKLDERRSNRHVMVADDSDVIIDLEEE